LLNLPNCLNPERISKNINELQTKNAYSLSFLAVEQLCNYIPLQLVEQETKIAEQEEK
jgi:hypothetical protein